MQLWRKAARFWYQLQTLGGRVRQLCPDNKLSQAVTCITGVEPELIANMIVRVHRT
jgi:hypothetical protein